MSEKDRMTVGCHRVPSPLLIGAVLGLTLLRGTAVQGQDRKWLPSLVEEVAIEDRVLEDRDGLLFGSPAGLRASPRGGFVIFDWGDRSFREYAVSGDLLWKSGRFGEGPGEFSRPLDWEFDAAGNLIVLDVDLIRLTVLGPDGTMLETHRVRDARQVMPTGFNPGGWAVMPHQGRDSLWVPRGGTSRSVPSPVVFVDDLVGEAWAANLKSGGAVVVYRWSSDIVWLRPDGSVRGVTQAVEATPFPELVYVDESFRGGRIRGVKVDPQAIALNNSQPAVDFERVFDYSLGGTENSGKIVDTYSVATGEYLGSYRLPHVVNSIAVLEDGRLVTLEVNLVPTLRIWRIER